MKNQQPVVQPWHAFNQIPLRSFFCFSTILFSFLVIFSSCQKEEIISMPVSDLPSLIEMDPISGSTDVSLDKMITATFDQNLDTSKVIVSCTLQKDMDMISGSVELFNHQAVFTPDNPLNPDSEYVFTINVIENIPGARTMEKHYSAIFRTIP